MKPWTWRGTGLKKLLRGTLVLMALGTLIAASLATVPARAASLSIIQGLKFDGGFQELVISVPDLEDAIEFYQRVAGWRVIQRGAAQPEMLDAWALPDSAKAIEAVLQNPNDPNGFIRLIKFRGVSQEEVRPSGHPWDTGGLAGFTVTTSDAQAKYMQFRQGGWHAYAQPVQIKRNDGVFTEVMLQGFGDEVINMLQPMDISRDKNTGAKDLSAALTAFATVADLDTTLAFYTDKLGFKIFRRDDGPTNPPGRNPLGLPHNLANNVYQRSAVLHPQGDNPANPHMGALRFTTYYGAQGEDFSSRAHAPNLGIIAVRFAVSDADARLQAIKAKGITPVYEPTDVGMGPYGAVTVFGVRDPNGILLEFFEPREKP